MRREAHIKSCKQKSLRLCVLSALARRVRGSPLRGASNKRLYASLRVMYTRFFGLRQQPFSIAPDPRYLFMSERHREALAHLLYGLNGGGGFVLLTGEVGAGKTTVCRLFLEQIPAQCNVAYIFNPKQTAVELLQSICDEFGVAVPGVVVGAPSATIKNYIDPLNVFLLNSHALQKNNILIIDEAQNLALDVLEQLRLLTNLETNERKLLQIVLIGQPELRAMLARPELEQLAQRVIARFHLEALSAKETAQYITHRLKVAGMEHRLPFSTAMMRRIHVLAGGIPRRINLLCDRALLGAYAHGKQHVDARTLALASREVFGQQRTSKHKATISWYSAIALLLLGVGSAVGVIEFMPDLLPSRHVAAVRPAMTADLSTFTKSPGAVESVETAKPVFLKDALPVDPLISTTIAVPATIPKVMADNSEKPAAPLMIGSDVRNLQKAFRQLGMFWSLSLGTGNSCQAARRQSVYCFSGKNGLTEIGQLNRPGILTLYDDQNQKYYAVLTELGGNTATLQLGQTRETVQLSTLATRWRGGFITLWRGPPDYVLQNVKGAHGPINKWIASRLAKVAAMPASTANAALGNDLDGRLRQFQLAQGLTPDGFARPQTLMRLAAAAGDTEPTLLANDNVVVTMPARK